MAAAGDPGTDAKLGSKVCLGDHVALLGSCSWTDRTLVQDADWYPKRTMSAEERLRFYAAQFPLDRDRLDVLRAAGRATGAAVGGAARPTAFALTSRPTRCSPVIRRGRTACGGSARAAPPEVAGKRNVYASHLEPDALDGGLAAVRAALRRCTRRASSARCCSSTRRGSRPAASNRAELEALRERLPDYRICVEFRSPRWLAERPRPRAHARAARGPRARLRLRRRAGRLGLPRLLASHELPSWSWCASTAAPTAPGLTRTRSARRAIPLPVHGRRARGAADADRRAGAARPARLTCS